ncbi:MAG: DUF2520 domain-containing protein [Clostridiales bacterium]|nr:DUF2520 domain-containing protein [Clostridiales bacterium]
MNIGFIGAGKVGFSMGKYLTGRGKCVTGYYSRSPQSSLEAAAFTQTRQYTDIESLVRDSDMIFLTVSDGAISSVWEQVKLLPIQNKMILHCSGSLSSAIFSDIGRTRACGYSIHPLLAVNDRYTSWEKLGTAFFTLEGDDRYLCFLKEMFEQFGNTVEVISAENKIRYHAAAAVASNLYVGLVDLSEDLLCSCGFSSENAHAALAPLILGNAQNIADAGVVRALTGPIERNDAATVSAHLSALSGEAKEIYRLLSKQVVKVAQEKHPERDFDKLEGVLTS